MNHTGSTENSEIHVAVKEKAGEDDGEDADEEAVAGDAPEAGAELDEDQLIEAEAVAADKIVAK